MLTHAALALVLLAPALVLAAGCDPEGPEDRADDGEEGGREGAAQEPPASQPRPSAAIACEEGVGPTSCRTEDGAEGWTQCILVDGEPFHTPCAAEVACAPGDGWDYGCMGSICAWDGAQLYWYSWSEGECVTPLVVSFDGGPISFEPAGAAGFDVAATGECLSTDWPSAPWLALDRDGDGAITDGRELFGSGTRLAGGARASDGFLALAELDVDHDGAITPADPAFAELVVWSDVDGDRRGELRELVPLAALEVVAIHLDAARISECDERGNCGGLRSTFEFRGQTGAIERGAIVDVFLACR